MAQRRPWPFVEGMAYPSIRSRGCTLRALASLRRVEGRGSASSRSTLATAAVVRPALSASSAWVSALRVRKFLSLSPTYTTAACMLAISLFAYRFLLLLYQITTCKIVTNYSFLGASGYDK